MKPDFDVAILGAGMAGSTLALILQRSGLRVLLVDRQGHPRFALGESTIVPASLWLKRLATRFDLPELDFILESPAPRCGVKRCFGLAYHRQGAPEPERRWMNLVPPSYQGSRGELHLFREDVDAGIFNAARGSGVDARTNLEVLDVEFHADGATVKFAEGTSARARCVVDTTGYKSLLADQLGLRDKPTRLRTNSRSIFTHLHGVPAYETCDNGPMPIESWHHGTMHHLTEHAWVWVIPFDNHPGAASPLCSVGLNLDRDFLPESDEPAEVEWQRFLRNHPAISRHLSAATAIRPWVKTGRLQFSNHATVGDRFIVLGQAAGAVDALYSRGLLNVLQSIDTAATLLLQACREDVFDTSHFRPLDRLQQKLLTIHDELVWGSYKAMHSPDLFQQWLLIWAVSERLGISQALPNLEQALRTGDRSVLHRPPHELEQSIAFERVFRLFLDGCIRAMDQLLAGEKTEAQVMATLRTELHSMIAVGIDYRAMEHSLTRTHFRTAA